MKHTKANAGLASYTAPGGPLHQAASRVIHTLVWHTTATPSGRDYTSRQIEGWHLKRKFREIGYHLVVHLDGSVSAGRPFERIGAHVRHFNTGSLGYSYVGGLDHAGKGLDTRTAAQKTTMLKLTEEAVEYYGVSDIKGHRDFSPDLDGDGVIEPFEFIKECPCFNAGPEYAHLLNGDAAPTDAIRGVEVSVEDGLRSGAVGDDVLELQALLGVAETGEFDKATSAAVIRAKRSLGLYPSEIVLPYVLNQMIAAKLSGNLVL